MGSLIFKPVDRTIFVQRMEDVFVHQMNLRLPGFDWSIDGSFSGSWSLVAKAKDNAPTHLELNMVRMVANEVFRDLGLSDGDVQWGIPAKAERL